MADFFCFASIAYQSVFKELLEEQGIIPRAPQAPKPPCSSKKRKVEEDVSDQQPPVKRVTQVSKVTALALFGN